MNKKGISVVSLSITIVILIVIVSTISVSITYSIANAKKLTFAKEIYNIQSLVTEYIQKENVLPITTSTIQIQLPSKDFEQLVEQQFKNEKITDEKLLLNVLDLTELDIVNTNYGNKQIGEVNEEKEKDVYAVSADTGRVYYIAGFKDTSKTYYTLTDDLLQMIEKKQELLIGEKTIIFTPSKIGWSNEAISVKVTVPETYTDIIFEIDNDNINHTESTVDDKKVYNVNSNNVLENYTITVTYTKDGKSNTISYTTKVDITAPEISKDSNVANTTTHIKGLKASDSESGIKYFKYVEGIINDSNAKEYVILYGKKVNKSSIKMKIKSVYTLYAEDKAGNYTVLHVDGDGDRFYPTVETILGTNSITLNNFYNLDMINYRIYGNSVQNGVPDSNNPVEIECVGELVTDQSDSNYGKYKIPITVSGKNMLNPDLFKYFSGTAAKLVDRSIFVKANTTYQLSIGQLVNCTSYRINFVMFDSSKKLIENTSGGNAWNFPITLKCKGNSWYWSKYHFVIMNVNLTNGNYPLITFTPNQDMYIAWCIGYGDTTASTYAVDPQIEEGTAATSYEPYVEPVTTNIYLDEPLRKVGAYRDYIDYSSQKLFRRVKEITINGNEEWKVVGNLGDSKCYFGLNIGEYNKVIANLGYNTHFENKTTTSSTTTIGFDFINSSTYNSARYNIRPDMSVFTTLSSWKSYLEEENNNGTPIKAMYALSKEETYDIELPNIETHPGTNIISIGTDIAPSQTEITYYKKQ